MDVVPILFLGLGPYNTIVTSITKQYSINLKNHINDYFFLGGSSNLINITKPYSQKKILIKIDPEDSPVFNKL